MTPFVQNVLLTVLSAACGCCATIIAYIIKHRDEKKEQKDREYVQLGEKMDEMKTAFSEKIDEVQINFNERIDKIQNFDVGLGQDRITQLGEKLLRRGGVTLFQLHDLEKNLYEPYKAMGGDSYATDTLAKVKELDVIDDAEKDRRDHIIYTGGERYWEEIK